MVSFISTISLFLRLPCSKISQVISLSLSHRWRFEWKHWSRRTQEMLTKATNAYDRGGSRGSFPLLWHWWKCWNTIQWVYCSPMSHLSSQRRTFTHCTYKTNYYSPHPTHTDIFIPFSIHHGGLLQKSKLGSPQLEATFDTIIQAFIFLDKNGDGKLNRKEMVKALNEASPYERSPARITKTRFSIALFIKDTPYISVFVFVLYIAFETSNCLVKQGVEYIFIWAE